MQSSMLRFTKRHGFSGISLSPASMDLAVAICAQDAISRSSLRASINIWQHSTIEANLFAAYLNANNYFSRSDSPTGANGCSLRPKTELRYGSGTPSATWSSDLDCLKWDIPGALGAAVDYRSQVALNIRPLLLPRFSLTVCYRLGHDAPRTEGVMAADSLDQRRDANGGLNYSFGGAGARATVKFSHTEPKRQYTSNRCLIQSFRGSGELADTYQEVTLQNNYTINNRFCIFCGASFYFKENNNYNCDLILANVGLNPSL